MKYIGRWSSYAGMLQEFCNYSYEEPHYNFEELQKPIPNKREVLFASYGGGAYEGDAVVIFKKGDKLYEVNGSHCSCYGLEGQWKPEETTVEALAKRGKRDDDVSYYYLYSHDAPAYEEYWKLVKRLQRKPKEVVA